MGIKEVTKLLDEAGREEAERALLAAAERSRIAAGPASTDYAAALFEVALLRMTADDGAGAIAPLREAASIRARGLQAEKERMKYAINLGIVLGHVGAVEEAEVVLRADLEDRKRIYGAADAGYAYGLEALASVLFARDKLEEALGCADEACRIFWKVGDERIAHAFATRAPIARASNCAAFNDARALPAPVFDEMAQAVLEQDLINVDAQLAAVRELAKELAERSGRTHALFVPTLIAITNLAREAREHKIRIDASDLLVAIMDERGDVPGALHAELAAALARDEAGDDHAAREAYAQARGRAQALGNACALSNTLRNIALFEAAHDRREEAVALFDEALRAVANTTDPLAAEEEARALVAYGVFLAHDGKDATAAQHLRRGIAALPSSDVDAHSARSHLGAIERGEPCACRARTEAFRDVILELLMGKVADDLLAGLRIERNADGRPSVSFECERRPSSDEMKQLGSALNQALASCQANLRASRGASRHPS